MTVTTSITRRSQAVAAPARNLRRVHVPFVGSVMIPPPDRVAYYTGMGYWPLSE